MKQVLTDTKLFDTECGKIEILVSFERHQDKQPLDRVEFHGIHYLDESSEDILLTAVEIVIPNGMSIDILPSLNYHQQQHIINNID